MIHHEQLRLDLTRLCLREHQRFKGLGSDYERSYPALLEFDTVMETPRRARTSIGNREQRALVLGGNLIVHVSGCRLARAILVDEIDIVDTSKGGHLIAYPF